MYSARFLLAFTASFCVHSAYGGSVRHPHELVVIRDAATAQCTHVSLRETQIYKGLPADGVSISTPTIDGGERLRFIHHNAGELWTQSYSLCGPRESWNFPALIGGEVQALYSQRDAQQVLTVLGPVHDFNTSLLELAPLGEPGDSSNRVDLVFFSDGYTAEEKDAFLLDAERLALDISRNQTFYTVKPLLNFWAAFIPSNESGVGVAGIPKDTPFGLYRPGTELRGVFYDKPDAARAACFSLGDKCDYPILMGNDPLYGGLGGEFTVITPSLANGPIVLRHELGHSIIDVGEEYDGGYDGDYFGVNAADSISEPISWAHWLTNSTSSQAHHGLGVAPPVRVERSVMPLQTYAWTMLNTSAPWSATFESAGMYSWHLVRFSLSGLPEKGDIVIELDGEELDWNPRPNIGVDRWHYDIHRESELSRGKHEVKFTLKNPERQGVAQLCNAEILEFGDAEEFIAIPGYYGVFPTYSETNETTYRPTNEDCNMRLVTAPNFCSVCLEGLWHALLRRVDLIDDLRTTCVGAKRVFELDLVPLAHLRDEPVDVDESYTITWRKDGMVLDAFVGQTYVELDDMDGTVLGVYTVDVEFATAEVRIDPDKLLTAHRSLSITDSCEYT